MEKQISEEILAEYYFIVYTCKGERRLYARVDIRKFSFSTYVTYNNVMYTRIYTSTRCTRSYGALNTHPKYELPQTIARRNKYTILRI